MPSVLLRDTIECKIFESYINFMDFTVSLQNAKIVSAKMNGQLVMWLDYACDP